MQSGGPIATSTLPKMLHHEVAAVPHGFRSLFRDQAAVEAALAHVVGNRTEAAYARRDLFERRRHLMSDWAAYLDGGRRQFVPLRR